MSVDEKFTCPQLPSVEYGCLRDTPSSLSDPEDLFFFFLGLDSATL